MKNTPPDMHMGKLVKRLLKQKNIKAKKFAEQIGLKHRSVYDLFKRNKLHT